MSTVTEPTNIPDLSKHETVKDRLVKEHDKWIKAKRSGDMSAQMRDARIRVDKLLDEMLLLRLEATII